MQIGHTRYGDCLEADFEVRSGLTGSRTRFHLAYPTAGPLAEVPVRVVYRPRWWFEVELTLAGSRATDHLVGRRNARPVS